MENEEGDREEKKKKKKNYLAVEARTVRPFSKKTKLNRVFVGQEHSHKEDNVSSQIFSLDKTVENMTLVKTA